jgi:hypothetical protein
MSHATPASDAPSKPPKRFRRTRIAVSVFFGMLTVASCVLWVRSQLCWDKWYNPISDECVIIVESSFGRLVVLRAVPALHLPWNWHISGPVQGDGWVGDHPAGVDPNKRTGGFDFVATAFHTAVLVPYWFPVLILAVLSIASGWSCAFHFSLRTLLTATTLVAILLGLAPGWHARLSDTPSANLAKNSICTNDHNWVA